MIKPNDQIGPYTLIRQLGKGGFGVVWLAERRSQLATVEVAIKLILDDEPDMDAIAKESQVWVKAGGHPNVLSIIEANIYDNQVAIVSEYVPDGSLQDFLKTYKEVSLQDALILTCGILAGLEHLHSCKILHRDLKPANILLNKGVPRLADFGLARVMKSSSNSGSIAGTPSYMAPEAFDGKRFVQSDIWSVGVILYQLLSRQLPFPQTDMTALIGAIINREPQPLPSNIPNSVQEIVKKALHKDISHRFQSTTDMRLILQKIAAELDLPTLESEITTAHLSSLSVAATTKISKDKSDTFGNRLNTNTLPQNDFLNNPYTPNQTLKQTEKVVRPFQMVPPTEVIAPSKWKTYVGLGILALGIPLGGFTYFKSQTEQSDLIKQAGLTSEKNVGAVVVDDKSDSLSNASTLSTQSIDQEQIAWQKVNNKKLTELTPKDVKAYLNEFPNGSHAVAAKELLKSLENKDASQTNSQPNTQTNEPVNKETTSSSQIASSSSSGMYMKTSNGNVVEVEGLGNDRTSNRVPDDYSRNANPGVPPNNRPPKNYLDQPNGANPSSFSNIDGNWREMDGPYRGRVITIQNGKVVSSGDNSMVSYSQRSNNTIGYKSFNNGIESSASIQLLSDREAIKTCYQYKKPPIKITLVKQ